ncbi:MAG: extracellular solute-binding protein [Spirochaetia bacterium]|jgi:ABC-type glycerol-3-phosphate transport system substrate-binding protein
MNKRIIAILLCFALALVVTVSGMAAPKKVTITVQMFSGPEYDAMAPTAKYWNEKYSASTGITVNAVALSRMGYQEKMQSQLVAGLRDPDLVHPFNMQLGKLRPYLEDLRPYLAKSDIMTGPDGEKYSIDGLLEVAKATVTTNDGAILGMPKDMSELLVYYRKDIITKPPETWPELVEMAKKYTKKVNPSSPTEYGVVMNGKYEKWTYCSGLEALWPAGYEIFKPGDKEIADPSADAVKAFKIYEDLNKAGALYPGFDNTEYPEISAALESGNVAMAVQWNANYFSLSNKEMSPKVYDKIALAAPPGWKQSDGKIKRSMYVQTINLALNKKSANKDAAMKFLAWSSLGEGAILYAKFGGSSPIKKVWLAKDAMMPYPVIAPMVQQYGRSLPMHDYMSELVMIGSSWFQKVGIGGATAEQAAKGLPEEMDSFIKAR